MMIPMTVLSLLKDFNNIDNGDWLSRNIEDILSYYKSESNSLVKLGYIDRITRTSYKKLKNIPEDLTFTVVKDLTKGVKLPILKKYTVWGGLVLFLNEQKTNTEIHIDNSTLENQSEVYQNLSWARTLSIIGYVEILEKKSVYNDDGFIKLKLLNKIPTTLSTTFASKMAYNLEYKRIRKIDKIVSKIKEKQQQ